MKRYLTKRVVTGLFVVLLSVCINFVLIRLAPGNPITILAGTDNPNPEMIATLTAKYGLDKSILEQFGMFLVNLSKGDLGFSYISNEPVVKIIGDKLIPTLLLTLTSLVISASVGIALGVRAARSHGSKLDRFLCSFTYVFDSIPSFWLGLMLILLLSSTLKLFPTSGMINLRENYTGFRYILDVMYHLFLPVLTLVIIQFPNYFRITRSSIMQNMSEEYVQTFKATGMSEKRIFNKYVLKNALLPTLTVIGMSVAFLFSGAALVETVFGWPGMGRLLISAIGSRDYQVLTGIYFVLSLSVAVVMIVIDILYSLADPRVRYE